MKGALSSLCLSFVCERSDLPSRLNTCRVAVYGGEPEILIGLSGRISVDFDSVRQSEKPQWKPKADAVEIRTESEGALSRTIVKEAGRSR